MRGTPVRLSAPRRFLIDMLHFAARVPSAPVQRRMHLAPVARARAAAAPRPGWPAVFIKAFARVAADVPELRRAFVRLPWPHLYEYPTSVATIAVEREYLCERAVFFGRIDAPAERSLADTDAKVREFAEAPIASVKGFRKMLRLARLPRPARRFLMWLGLNLPRSRPAQFGTFGLSAYSSLGAESLHPISPLTITMTYGVIDADGAVDVRLVYDHRVLDGATVARALTRMEAELTGPILEELRAMCEPRPRGECNEQPALAQLS